MARAFGYDWHAVNASVVAYREALPEADDERIGEVTRQELDEWLVVLLRPRAPSARLDPVG
jgi:hypothetical protein